MDAANRAGATRIVKFWMTSKPLDQRVYLAARETEEGNLTRQKLLCLLYVEITDKSHQNAQSEHDTELVACLVDSSDMNEGHNNEGYSEDTHPWLRGDIVRPFQYGFTSHSPTVWHSGILLTC